VTPAPSNPPGPLTRVLITLVRVYQRTLALALGGRCRFYPSCSEYALDALGTHGPFRGLWLTIRRLSRCHPLGGHGVDLVPPATGPRSRTSDSCHHASDSAAPH